MVMLSMPGNLLFFNILMAFLTYSSVMSSVVMGRVYTGYSGWAGVAGLGQFSTSLKCSTHLASFSSPLDRGFPSLAKLGQILKG